MAFPSPSPSTRSFARVLHPFQAYSWSIVIHMLLAGLLTYGYGRVIGLGSGACLLAALSYQMSSEVVAGSSGFAAHSAFALPGALLAVELVLRRGWRYGPALSLVVAAALLGGHTQLVLLALVTTAIYALFRLAGLSKSVGMRPAAISACWLLLAALLGVAGAAVRLLPTWDMVGLSTRAGGLPPEASSAGALTLLGLFVGNLMPLSRLQTVPWGAAGYAGPAVLVLTILQSRNLFTRPLGKFFLGLGLFSALLSLGQATPLNLLTQLPLLSLFREPARFSLLTTFALAMLGGMALEEFGRSVKGALAGSSRRLLVSTVITAVLVASFFALGAVFQFGSGPTVEALRSWSSGHFVDALNPLRPRMGLAVLGIPLVLVVLVAASRRRLSLGRLEALLVGIVFAALVPVATILNPPIDSSVVGKVPETVRYLQQQPDSYRIFGHRAGTRLYNHMHFYGPGPEVGFTDDLRYRFQAEMLAPVLNLRWGIASADGYEQLHSSYQETLLRYLDSERISNWEEMPGHWGRLTMEQRLPVLRMLNVRYLLSGIDLAEEAPSLRQVAHMEVGPGPNSRAPMPVYMLEIPDPLPRYYLVSKAQTFSGDVDALDAVAAGEVDPATTVLLPAGETAVPEAISTSDEVHPRGSVETVSLRNGEVVLRVSNDRPAYLVTSDSYWPGWRAFVDGREVPVLRADVAGRAVQLDEAGGHSVVFRFEPAEFSTGLAISLASAAIFVGWLLMNTLLVWLNPMRR